MRLDAVAAETVSGGASVIRLGCARHDAAGSTPAKPPHAPTLLAQSGRWHAPRCHAFGTSCA